MSCSWMDVSARLHLDIPLDGEMTTAKGDVVW
jgi:uncharacterized protein YhdP